MPGCLMPFPKDWHEFLKDYSFDDSQEAYTNGSRLIPVFRVEQLIEHLLRAQEPVEVNCEHQCNKCKFYEGVHNVMGHAPCSLWKIGGVMWNDYCSRFNLWKESEVE